MSPAATTLREIAAAHITGVFIAGVIVLACICFFADHHVQRVFAARRMKRRAALLGARQKPADVEPGATITIAGELTFTDATGDKPRTLATFTPLGHEAVEDATLAARSAALEGTPAVKVGSDVVVLEGPVQVITGSRESPRDVIYAYYTDAWTLPKAPEQAGIRGLIRMVRAGDRVVVRGRLAIHAGQDARGNYRDRTVAYRLEPAPDPDWRGRPIVLAFDGAPNGIGPPTIFGGLSFVAAIAGFVALLFANTTELATEQARAAAQVHDSCPDVDRANDEGRPWDALAIRGCADPLRAARAHFLAGDFANAARDFEAARKALPDMDPSLSEIQTYVLANDTTHAIAALDLRAGPARQSTDLAKMRIACIKSALVALAGNPADRNAAARAAAQHSDERCKALAGALDESWQPAAPSYEAYEWFASWEFRPPTYPSNRQGNEVCTWPVLLEARLDLWLAAYPPDADRVRAASLGASLASPKEQVRASMSELAGKATAAVRLATFDAYAGNSKDALERIEVLDTLHAKIDGYHGKDLTDENWQKNHTISVLQDLFFGGASVAILAGDFARADTLVKYGREEGFVAVDVSDEGGRTDGRFRKILASARAAGPSDFKDELRNEDWTPSRELFQLAAAADGAAVADRLVQDKWHGRNVLWRVVPHLTSGKDALAAWATTKFPQPCWTCGVVHLLQYLADRRSAAHVLGLADLEQRLAAPTDALAASFVGKQGPILEAIQAIEAER